MDFAIQRTNMVESQVRPSDVTDRRIIRAMLDIPRECFVPEVMRPLAYSDASIRLGAKGRVLLPARTLAKLLQAADIEPDASILVVGAGGGYAAAIVSKLARHVTALECDEALATAARAALESLEITTIAVVSGELGDGWVQDAPYDAIVVDGGLADAPPSLLGQLKDGGRLVAVRMRGPMGKATVWRRQGSVFGAVEIFDASATVLPGFEPALHFAL